MSIIYEALKKVEKSGHLKTETEKPARPFKFQTNKMFFLYLLMACLGIFIGNIFFNLLSRPKTPLTKQWGPIKEEIIPGPIETPPQEAKVPALIDTKKRAIESLVLNGMFFSEDQGYALVNNQIIKEGDLIEGAVVKRITLNEIELEYEGSTFKLSTNQ